MQKGETLYTWYCGICLAKFTSPGQYGAFLGAQKCEQQGRPANGLKVGARVKLSGAFGCQSYFIYSIKYRYEDHEPVYLLVDTATLTVCGGEYTGRNLTLLS